MDDRTHSSIPTCFSARERTGRREWSGSLALRSGQRGAAEASRITGSRG